jgi:hypothetical protein
VSAFACAHAPWSHDPKWASYRAPEALRAGALVDERAEVFSVGVLLWEMLRNRPLFGGARFEAVERSVAQGSIGRADSLRPQRGEAVERKLGDAVARALERDPQARFASLGEMADGLRTATDSIAGPDGVAAFVERFAAESLGKQRKLFAPPDEASAEPVRNDGPKGTPALPAVGRPTSASSPPGLPDFHELFGSSPPPAGDRSSRASDSTGAEGVTDDQGPCAPGPGPPSSDGLLSIGDEPGDGAEPVPSAAAAPAPGKRIPRGAFLLAAAAVLVLVLLWVAGPLGGRSTAPTADTATSSASATGAASMDAGAGAPVARTSAVSAPGSTEPLPDASAEPADAGGEVAPSGDADGGAKAKTKGKKKKPKSKYMPGTL